MPYLILRGLPGLACTGIKFYSQAITCDMDVSMIKEIEIFYLVDYKFGDFDGGDINYTGQESETQLERKIELSKLRSREKLGREMLKA